MYMCIYICIFHFVEASCFKTQKQRGALCGHIFHTNVVLSALLSEVALLIEVLVMLPVSCKCHHKLHLAGCVKLQLGGKERHSDTKRERERENKYMKKYT